MHFCRFGERCSDPLLSRKQAACKAAQAEFVGANERAAEAGERFAAWLDPNQIQQMTIHLATSEATRLDRPCTEMMSLVQKHLGSPELPLLAACIQGGGYQGAWIGLCRRVCAVLDQVRLPPGVQRAEVLSIALVRLWGGALQKYDDCHSLDAFLGGIVRNALRRLCARGSCLPLPPDAVSPDAGPERHATDREMRALIQEFLDSLPELPRQVLTMRMDGEGLDAIMARTGVASRKVVARILRDLRPRCERIYRATGDSRSAGGAIASTSPSCEAQP
ncbi:MAG: sigma-70 family RNA polymerase sigma factor [Planctomycetes bacterium]|jgi:DNA-directed RNA polymerase specialized sigma24 family protein|nr:sigma-70 family RNA polymerase sigma factor [Planctomycetota bacterium]